MFRWRGTFVATAKTWRATLPSTIRGTSTVAAIARAAADPDPRGASRRGGRRRSGVRGGRPLPPAGRTGRGSPTTLSRRSVRAERRSPTASRTIRPPMARAAPAIAAAATDRRRGITTERRRRRPRSRARRPPPLTTRPRQPSPDAVAGWDPSPSAASGSTSLSSATPPRSPRPSTAAPVYAAAWSVKSRAYRPPSAISSSCVPSSTSAPCSRNRIRSACRTVEKRCEM